jgi:hypothetical protein
MEPNDLLRSVVAVFEQLHVPYFVTGSIATITYGEPRFTNDIDMVADLKESHVEPLCAAFEPPDYYISPDAVLAAVRARHQFNLIHVTAGLKVDIIVPEDTDFNRSRFARRRLLPSGPEGDAQFAAPEDVILKKLEYFREGGSEKHIRDIRGVLKVQGDRIDCAYLDEWAHRLGLAALWRDVQGRS